MMKKYIFHLLLIIAIPAVCWAGSINFAGGTWTIRRHHGASINVKKVEIETLEGGGDILIYTLTDGSEGFENFSNITNLDQLLKMAKTGKYAPYDPPKNSDREKYNRLKEESDRLQNEINTSERNLQQELDQMAASGGQGIQSSCEQKWGSDYSMVKYCIDKQEDAKRKVSARSGAIRTRCEQKWGADYSMVEYCIDKQTTAKGKIDSMYRNSSRRQHCERKWGTDYSMVEYCIET